jgi:hypothetical protein
MVLTLYNPPETKLAKKKAGPLPMQGNGNIMHVPLPPPRPDPPRPKGTRGRAAWNPEPIYRQLVEILISLSATQEAICRELVRQGQPCADVTTLQKAFPDEIAHGKERKIHAYGVKIHQIAMSDAPGAFNAARYMLMVHGGAEWRVRAGDVDHVELGNGTTASVASGDGDVVVVKLPDNGRGFPEGHQPQTIEGEAVEKDVA